MGAAIPRLRSFAGARGRWIVAVNMVSEGVDIPRLRVGVYATTAKTAMIFRQIVGRFVRTGSGTEGDSWLFLPAEPVLRAHAAKIEDEIHRVARREDARANGSRPSGARASAATSRASSPWRPTPCRR